MSRETGMRAGHRLLPLLGALVLAACGGADEEQATTNVKMPSESELRRPLQLSHSAQLSTDVAPTSAAAVMSIGASPQAQMGPVETSTGVVLKGAGLRRGLQSGCTPSLYEDFIDSQTWNNRRLVPSDCALVKVQAPLFSWRHPTDRDETEPWTLKLMRSSGEVVLSTQVVHTRLQLQQLLTPGDYKWTVSYRRDRGDRQIITSAARRFTVASDASSFRPPDGAALAAQVARKSRPHVLPAGASFSAIAGKALGGEYAQRYNAFVAAAERLLSEPIPVEPPAPNNDPNSKAYKDWKSDLTGIVRKERKDITTLAFAWRFTGKTSYRDAARKHIVELAKWSPSGGSGYETNDLANAMVFVTLARGIDLLDGALNDDQRKSAVNSLKARLSPARAGFATLDTAPYDSHNVQVVRDVVNALLAAAGSFPEAEGWLAETWELYVSTLATWGGDDGSWGNGNGYGWNMIDGFGEVLASAKLIAGVDLSQSDWVRRFGNTLIANTAPAGEHMSAFGDAAEKTENYGMYAKDLFRLYAAVTRLPVDAWYWRVGDAANSKDTLISPFHFMLLALDLPEVVPTAATQASYIFTEAGVVAMNDNVAASDRSSVFFRSSRFGSFSHSHADQNAFTLVSQGNDVLISGGYYPYFMSPHHATVTRATRYKNALTFDGGIGQAEPVKNPTAPGKPKESMDARGELINYRVSGNWTVATGDATLAYRGWDDGASTWRPLLSNAIRSIAYNRQEHVVVIYDWATSDSARRWELNFNSLEAFTVSGASAQATGKSSSACIDIYGGSGSFSKTSGFAVAPEGNYPTQYQAHYKVGSASNELVAVTVIREACRSVPVNVNVDGLSATVRINGGPALSFSGRTATIS